MGVSIVNGVVSEFPNGFKLTKIYASSVVLSRMTRLSEPFLLFLYAFCISASLGLLRMFRCYPFQEVCALSCSHSVCNRSN